MDRPQVSANAAVVTLPRVPIVGARCRSELQYALVRVNNEKGIPVEHLERQASTGY